MRRIRHKSRPLLGAVITLLGVALLAGCGGDDDGAEQGAASLTAPATSEFPPAKGRTLEQILAEADAAHDLVISPTGQVFRRGENRFGFGVFTVGREQVTDAEVAIYAAHGPKGPAQGPFPARIESMETAPAFTAQTTAADPDAAQVVYVAEIPFDRDGEWRLLGLAREGDGYSAARIPSVVVGPYAGVPAEGEKAPSVHTPTADEVADIAEIDTREPPDTMHEEDLADVLGEKPVVLLFATPRLCVSRVCGPVVDVAEQLKADYGEDAAFIHMEIYEDNSTEKGLRSQVRAYGLPTEPWLFVIGRDGRVSTAIEGAFGTEELEQAIQKAVG